MPSWGLSPVWTADEKAPFVPTVVVDRSTDPSGLVRSTFRITFLSKGRSQLFIWPWNVTCAPCGICSRISMRGSRSRLRTAPSASPGTDTMSARTVIQASRIRPFIPSPRLPPSDKTPKRDLLSRPAPVTADTPVHQAQRRMPVYVPSYPEPTLFVVPGPVLPTQTTV